MKCDEQMDCKDFIWVKKARNEHVRRYEICTRFKDGACELLQGQSCLITKGEIRRLKNDTTRRD